MNLDDLKKLVPDVEVKHLILTTNNGHTCYYGTEKKIDEWLGNEDFTKGLSFAWDRGLSNTLKDRIIEKHLPLLCTVMKDKSRGPGGDAA